MILDETGRAMRAAGRLAVIFAASALLALIGVPVHDQIAGLHALAEHETPYWIVQKAWLLNLLGPLSAVAASVFLLIPGLALAMAVGQTENLVSWLIVGLLLSIALLCGTATFYHFVTGEILRGTAFIGMVGLAGIVALGAAWQAERAGRPGPPLGRWRNTLLFSLLTPFLMVAIFAPKFYWELFTPDGVEVLAFVKDYVHSDWPFLPPESGVLGNAPGLTSFFFALPGSWFYRLFGETEWATRMPLVLQIGLLHAVLAGVIEAGRKTRLGWPDHLLISAALLLYILSTAYSGGYHLYHADTPAPAGRETLAMAFFLAYAYAAVTGRMGLAWLAGVASYMTLPTGGLWLLLTFCAVFLVERPRDWRKLRGLFWIMVACAAFGAVGPMIVHALGMPLPGGEFNARNVINRLRYVTFWEPQRLAYLIVPLGILPALSLLLWPRHDRLSRVLVLIAVAFFAFFYFQGYRVLMHHFIPAMFPPLVVMWRLGWFDAPGRVWAARGAVALGLVAATILAFPNRTALQTYDRAFAAQIAVEGPHFEGYNPAAYDTFHQLFWSLLPSVYSEAEAAERYGGSPLVWQYYALRDRNEDGEKTYLLQPDTADPPAGARAHDTVNGHTLFVLDEARHQRLTAQVIPTDFAAPIYRLPMHTMFGRGAQSGDRLVIDLVAVARGILGIPR